MLENNNATEQTNNLNNIPQSYKEAEALINQFKTDAAKERPWFGDQLEDEIVEPKAKQPQPKQQQVQQPSGEFELEIDGKKVKFNSEDLKKYAQSGYRAEERYQQIIQEQEKIAKERAEFEGKRSQYDELRQLDNWARENPELFHRMRLEYENQRAGHDFGEVPPYLAKFVSELEQIKSRFSEIDNFQTQQRVSAQDKALDEDINAFKKEHPQFDWNSKELERRILLHAQDNKIPSFRAAARDLLFDELVKRNELKAKETIGKEIQKSTKLGEIQKSSAYTTNQNSKSINPSKMNWHQLAEQIKKSHGFKNY